MALTVCCYFLFHHDIRSPALICIYFIYEYKVGGLPTKLFHFSLFGTNILLLKIPCYPLSLLLSSDQSNIGMVLMVLSVYLVHNYNQLAIDCSDHHYIKVINNITLASGSVEEISRPPRLHWVSIPLYLELLPLH